MSSCTENTEKIQRLKNIKGLQSMIIQIEKKPEIVKTQKKMVTLIKQGISRSDHIILPFYY